MGLLPPTQRRISCAEAQKNISELLHLTNEDWETEALGCASKRKQDTSYLAVYGITWMTAVPPCGADCNKRHVQCESMPAVGNTQCNSLQLSLQAPDVLLCVLIQGTSHWWQVFVHVHKCQLLNIHFGEGRVTDKGPELAEPKTLS